MSDFGNASCGHSIAEWTLQQCTCNDDGCGATYSACLACRELPSTAADALTWARRHRCHLPPRGSVHPDPLAFKLQLAELAAQNRPAMVQLLMYAHDEKCLTDVVEAMLLLNRIGILIATRAEAKHEHLYAIHAALLFISEDLEE